MAGRLLSFKDYIGGADNVQVIEMFPKSQKNFTYDFEGDISSYTFTSDMQSILLDSVSYDRTSGLINFADTTVSGYFTNTADLTPGNFTVLNATEGTVQYTLEDNRYTGFLTPDARTNVVVTVVSVEWSDGASPKPGKDLHRWAIVERWEPGVTIGDPKDAANTVTFVSLTA
mgnify:FL=1